MRSYGWKSWSASILFACTLSCLAKTKDQGTAKTPPSTATPPGTSSMMPATPMMAADPCADPSNTSDACVPPYQGDHPIDRVLHPILWKQHITPVEAAPAELCRRLFADLLGRVPSTD